MKGREEGVMISAILNLLHALLSLLGRLFGQAWGARRELDNKRRDLRVQFLVEAWRNIERASNRTGRKEMRGLEQALADVQLLGTPSQADQAARVARSLARKATNSAAIDELLESLRVDLRDEMRLGRAVSPLVCLRMSPRARATPSASYSSREHACAVS
jgi:hypothetical protein